MTFKFWTVQKYTTLNTVLSDGIYEADFSKSWYTSLGKEQSYFYRDILTCYRNANRNRMLLYRGLIYAFAWNKDNQYITPFDSYQEFYEFIKKSKPAIASLWKQLAQPDACVLELEYDIEEFNPMFVDINDFQALMPPVMALPPYTNETLQDIWENLNHGEIIQSVFPSFLIQAHLPYIHKKHVKGVYPIFDI